MIPWNDFDDGETEEQSDRGWLNAVQAFNNFLRSLVLSMIALALALGSQNFTRPFNSKPGNIARRQFAKWCPTLLMLPFPLAPVTVDYAMGSSMNELSREVTTAAQSHHQQGHKHRKKRKLREAEPW